MIGRYVALTTLNDQGRIVCVAMDTVTCKPAPAISESLALIHGICDYLNNFGIADVVEKAARDPVWGGIQPVWTDAEIQAFLSPMPTVEWKGKPKPIERAGVPI